MNLFKSFHDILVVGLFFGCFFFILFYFVVIDSFWNQT